MANKVKNAIPERFGSDILLASCPAKQNGHAAALGNFCRAGY